MHGYILTYLRYNSWDYVKHAWLYSDVLQCYKKGTFVETMYIVSVNYERRRKGLCEACMAVF